MKITEKTDPKEVSKKTMETIKTIPSMHLEYPEGKALDTNTTDMLYFLNFINRKSFNSSSEYYEIGSVDSFTSDSTPQLKHFDKTDNSYELSKECASFVKSIKESFERNNIPFDQIQIRAGVRLYLKKDAFDGLKKIINENTTSDVIKHYIYEYFKNDLSECVDLEICGDCSETGTEEANIIEYHDGIERINCTNLSLQEKSKISMGESSSQYIIFRLQYDIFGGTVNLKDFIKNMMRLDFEIKFGDDLVNSENIEESIIEKFFENNGWFYMNMTYDYGRKVNRLVKKYTKQK